ncbi:MAG: hypothetical protein J0L63_17245 [Anaerolineae bacterium]|nr:hypothetical protein [Anaerolineae bacterium]
MKLRWLLIRQADRVVPAVDQDRAAVVGVGVVLVQGRVVGQAAIPAVGRGQDQVVDRGRAAVVGVGVGVGVVQGRVVGQVAILAADRGQDQVVVQGQAAVQGRVVDRDQAVAPVVGRGQIHPPLISHRRLTPLARKR